MMILAMLILTLAAILIFTLVLMVPIMVLDLGDEVKEWIIDRLHRSKGERKDAEMDKYIKRKDGRRC